MIDPSFEMLGLSPDCLKALLHEGYAKPTPIQQQSIPSLLEGRDLLGCAQTGTGKTAAFALPIIQRLSADHRKLQPRQVRSLVVAPTRELAAQIDASFAAYGRHSGLSRACVYGGVGKVPQVRALSRGVDVLVATPGRLLDLHHDGALSLAAVEIVVFDEADRMLDMGFIHDVRKIIALLPKQRQTLLFSATMPTEIEGLATGLLNKPVRVSIEPDKPAVESIAQTLYYVEKGAKRELLAHLVEELNVFRAIVFSRTKHGADRIARGLHAAGIQAGVIHANKGQGNRTRTMEAFRGGETRILVATDIAARGIDVDDISHVFNFDLPTEPETYVHRIGRTARAGASGAAISFCDTEEKKLLRQVEHLLGRGIPVVREHRYAGVQGEDHREPGEQRFGRGGRPDGVRPPVRREDRAPRADRPARTDRAPRAGQAPSQDRSPRSERGERPTSERPSDAQRGNRGSPDGHGRPAAGRPDRPAGGSGPRPASERPSGDRPARGGGQGRSAGRGQHLVNPQSLSAIQKAVAAATGSYRSASSKPRSPGRSGAPDKELPED
ncbi:MAG TPA: DEAD/DEAH box helicase [Spirochaetaceae bacterium]|nr:DEAD/DEAH box helicase [Spirochaetaceae bacterium]